MEYYRNELMEKKRELDQQREKEREDEEKRKAEAEAAAARAADPEAAKEAAAIPPPPSKAHAHAVHMCAHTRARMHTGGCGGGAAGGRIPRARGQVLCRTRTHACMHTCTAPSTYSRPACGSPHYLLTLALSGWGQVLDKCPVAVVFQ